MNQHVTKSLIPFNKPFIVGKELHYIAQAVTLGQISGDGFYTRQCSQLLQERFHIPRVLLTPSCTAALEMAAILCDLKPGDEVILPSYTFVSTANAIVREGATPVFVDIRPDTLNIDEALIEAAITPRTKAIFVVHYGGVSCEMETINDIARRHQLKVVEDAAQGVNAFYQGQPLGSLGDLATYSFHETKNYISGEGGALCINDPQLVSRAEIIRDKGTNRQEFFRGHVDKYTWVDVGSSYVPSEIVSAFLFGQLEMLEAISQRRETIYRFYEQGLAELEEHGLLRRPIIPAECVSNYHLFYILVKDQETRDSLMQHLNEAGIKAVFHYIPLHNSPYGKQVTTGSIHLPITENLSGRLLRLPMYYDITDSELEQVVDTIRRYFDR
ncbi:MAG: dTDP-4-amino-4,6-dideoxygalactose transaminase [Planctomycetaceae bacterium]|nr:dTDP-4-amino-4,6-dideoxygalactose transaminase [Planctomycetaceae bacterium]